MKTIPTKINKYNVYNAGNRLLGMGEEVTLPSFEASSETVSGAGVLGEFDDPTVGYFSNMELEIPILSTVFSGVYSMPEVGDQVLVLHLSNGSEAGVVLGRPWSRKTKPPEGAEKLYRLDMDRAPGVAMVRYDGKTKDLTIHCDGTLNITAGGAITINGKTIDLN